MSRSKTIVMSDVLEDVLNKLEIEIPNAIAQSGVCSIYIATLNSSNSSEIFANEKRLFMGRESTCRKILKEVLKDLEKKDYRLCGDLREVVTVKRG